MILTKTRKLYKTLKGSTTLGVLALLFALTYAASVFTSYRAGVNAGQTECTSTIQKSALDHQYAINSIRNLYETDITAMRKSLNELHTSPKDDSCRIVCGTEARPQQECPICESSEQDGFGPLDQEEDVSEIPAVELPLTDAELFFIRKLQGVNPYVE